MKCDEINQRTNTVRAREKNIFGHLVRVWLLNKTTTKGQNKKVFISREPQINEFYPNCQNTDLMKTKTGLVLLLIVNEGKSKFALNCMTLEQVI